MLNVSQAIKDKFQSDVCRKELKITIGNTVLTNSAIYKDGFRLTEAVMDGAVEFVGCIASMLEFKISTLALAKGNYKGATVTAEVAVYLNANTLSSYIPLFHGFVDECTKSADGYYQQFVCYDRLAYLSDEPGYNMYKAAFNGSSIDLETFRDAIVLDCGMDAVNSQTLPNDDIVFRKRKRNKDITAMALLRHIAQINGAFGILNRDNRFEFRQIDDAASPESVLYYRDLKYSDYVVKPVGDSTTTPPTGSITIRTNSQDAGVTVDWTDYLQYAGTDPGWSDESQDTYLVDDTDANVVIDSYIIESNLISYKLKKSKKQVIAANILASLGHDAVFREYSVKCNGLPYVECCDKVLFTKGDGNQIEFVVTKRVLEGIQNMTDTYSCTISSQDANNKTFVSNVDKNTNGLSGSPDDALGLTEKTITVNGTYAANDDGAEGYSQVTVNVSGGGTAKRYEYVWTPLDITIGTYVPDFATFTSHNAVVYNGRIHLFGQNTTATTLHVSWSDEDGYREESILPFSTFRSVFVADNTHIHLLGGTSGTGTGDYTRSHYIWDGNSWQNASAIIGSSLPMGLNTQSIPRYCISYDNANHKLYVVGGGNATLRGSVNVIDLDDHSLVSYPFDWTSPDTYLYANACWDSGNLYIMSFRTYDNLMTCYKMDSNGYYTQLNDTPWNYNEKGGALFEYDGALHYIGGGSTVPCGIRRYNASLDKWLDVGIYPSFQTTQFEDAPYSRPPLVIAPPKSSGLNAVKYNNVIHVIGLASTTGIGYAGHWKVEEVEVSTS